eukprot:SAG31_NODE_909_length_11079_cov_176.706102_2_plen_560_part_00
MWLTVQKLQQRASWLERPGDLEWLCIFMHSNNCCRTDAPPLRSLIKKIKNEDEDEEKLDGNDENKDFVERRRKLRAMLGDDNFALRTDEAADMGKDTVKHAQWEIDFIMMQRRKRTIAIVLVSLLICCIIGIPPVWVHMLDQDCADPSETRPDVFSFAAAEVEEIHITSYRGTVIVKAANSSTSSGQINVEVQSKAVSESALEAIKVTATEELLNNGRSVIHVMARFDEVAADSTFSLWNCPMSDITVTVPPVTYADAQPFGPSLNITMDGPEGSPILYPWIPNLIAVVGTVTLDMQPSMAVGGLAVTNKIDNVVVSGYAGKSLSVFTTVGDIYVSDAKLPAAQLVSSSGNVHIANVDLVDLETITQEDTTPHLFQSADLSAMASLGYSNIAPSLAGELTYGHQRYVYADSSSGDVIVSHIAHGNIRAHSGSGKLAVTLSTLGFSGYYELHAPFAPEDRGFWDGVVQEQRLQSLYSIRDNDMGEVDALYVNTTLLLEKLGASDTSEALDPLARVGRIFMHDGNVGGQRLLAESDCGDVSVLVKEELHNYTSLLNFLKEK